MKKNRRPFLKQKPVLYFDENFPDLVLRHLRKGSRWKKKIKVLSAIDQGNKGKADEFHSAYCTRNGYTLVTFDTDFNDDTAFPFANGTMPGIVIVKEARGDTQTIVRLLTNLLEFVLTTPFPKSFLTESKFTVSGEGCVMRGKDTRTKQIKSIQIIAGKTTVGEVREYFSY